MYLGICHFYIVEQIGKDLAEIKIKTEIKENIQKSGKSNVEKSSFNETFLMLSGWAFIDDMESSEQKVYVKIEYNDMNEFYYPAITSQRSDIASYYENSQYASSGFSIYVSENIENINRISLIVVNDNSMYSQIVYENK